MKVAAPTAGDRQNTTMTAPLRSRLGSPFRATNWACGPVKEGKNWSRFGCDVPAKIHFSQSHCYQSFGDQFFGSRDRKGAVISA
jgi:hypothetical protein